MNIRTMTIETIQNPIQENPNFLEGSQSPRCVQDFCDFIRETTQGNVDVHVTIGLHHPSTQDVPYGFDFNFDFDFGFDFDFD